MPIYQTWEMCTEATPAEQARKCGNTWSTTSTQKLGVYYGNKTSFENNTNDVSLNIFNYYETSDICSTQVQKSTQHLMTLHLIIVMQMYAIQFTYM